MELMLLEGGEGDGGTTCCECIAALLLPRICDIDWRWRDDRVDEWAAGDWGY